ncbi:hypothetical protein HBH92_076930 [Parastagonospora nodorum]|nr:hypothetical protein HBH47_024280 [Parastagonospora nodorum]KAH4202501.1 hypothetical protein HBH42_019110 [Parastagonospora nodorum]KAH4230687.1 hypothetical protein HBI06_084270 [Parastagonospora nodorum]KAH4245362.1 hypothetical protein HBI05_067410 [Parastagonospora nodorum]KAH4268421.1 hypothetical protein HBI03_058800 [Parastagonospora nodorum]
MPQIPSHYSLPPPQLPSPPLVPPTSSSPLKPPDPHQQHHTPSSHHPSAFAFPPHLPLQHSHDAPQSLPRPRSARGKQPFCSKTHQYRSSLVLHLRLVSTNTRSIMHGIINPRTSILTGHRPQTCRVAFVADMCGPVGARFIDAQACDAERSGDGECCGEACRSMWWDGQALCERRKEREV